MKKLLTLSLVVMFVAVSSLSFAQDDAAPTPIADAQPVQMMASDANCCGDNGGMMVSGGCNDNGGMMVSGGCYDNGNVCAPSYGCGPSYCNPCYDPCGAGYGAGCGPCGYGYRTPVRNFLGRLFAPRAYYGGCGPCAPYGGYGCGPSYGYGGCAPAYGCAPSYGYGGCAPCGGGYGYGGCCY